MRISDWSSDVCSSDLIAQQATQPGSARAVTSPAGLVQTPTSAATPPAGSSTVVPPLSALPPAGTSRSEEHTSELQSLMRISYAVFFLQKQKDIHQSDGVTSTIA